MEEIKVGDVVALKSHARVPFITVESITGDEFQGVYYAAQTEEFRRTPILPLATVAKVRTR